MWTIIAIVATCSVGFHLILLHSYAIKKIWECVSDREWFEALLPLGGIGGCILLDYVALKQIIPSATANGFSGAIKSVISLGPQAISLFNEFLAGLMADIFFIGFIPGGKIGFIIGTTLSVALNALFIYLFFDWLKDTFHLRLSKKRIG